MGVWGGGGHVGEGGARKINQITCLHHGEGCGKGIPSEACNLPQFV